MSTPADKQIKDGAKTFWSGLKSFFKDLTNLQEGMDREGTIVNIKNNKRMRGANAWLLMCSIMIASLGLDLNSPAVIIGAMLISPLMSPILGIGLGIGINDRMTLKISLQHFGIAIAIALVTSTLYFLFTPLGEYTSEISARTKPTLLDVMVAFFGGIAGIISGSRRDKSNAIPGVAIATALMPPLCVTGFGFATFLKHGGNWDGLNLYSVMSNSFYLFFLNATFVALATYLIVRLLQFPYKPFKDENDRRRTIFSMAAISIVMIIPSMFILINVLNGVQAERRLNSFIKDNFEYDWTKVDQVAETDSFKVKVFLFQDIGDNEKDLYRKMLVEDYQCKASIEFIEDEDMGPAEMKEYIEGSQKEEKNAQAAILNEKDKRISILTNKMDSLKTNNAMASSIELELSALYPEVDEISFYQADKDELPLILLKSKDADLNKNLESRIVNYVKTKTKVDSCIVIFQ